MVWTYEKINEIWLKIIKRLFVMLKAGVDNIGLMYDESTRARFIQMMKAGNMY